MRVLHFPVLAAALTLLAACQVPATYHPREREGGTGYTDTQLSSNRYRVSFTGNSSTKREVVENYLLLHAAEVTLKAGYHAFLFDTRDTEASTTYHSDFVGWPGYGGYWHSWPFDPFGDMHTRSYPVTRYEAYAEIVLLSAEQAKAEPRAIVAQEVLDHLGKQVVSN
jgi:hypothetical protein